jgi:hypothetical protein
MIERMEDVPAGVMGLRGEGKLTKDDYVSVLEPALNEAVDSGDARVVFVLEGFDGLELAAFPEDAKTGFGIEFKHRDAWKKLAFVTDSEWVAKAMHMFEWLTPGEVRIYTLDQLEEAKSWAAA